MSFIAVDGDHYSKSSKFLHIFVRSILPNYINPLKKKYDKILDLGCGPGDNAKFIKEYFKGDKYIGVDKTESFIDYARQNNKISDDIKYEICDLDNKEDLKAILNKNPDIDLVVSTYTLHWVENPDDMFHTFSSFLPGPVEHAHLVPIVKQELQTGISQNLIMHEKWNKYFQDIEVLSHYSNKERPKIPSDNFLNAISKLKYNILLQTDHVRTYTYETIESRIATLKWMSPHVQFIPKDLQEEFIIEILNKWKEENPGNEYDKVFECTTYILHLQSQ